MPNLELRCACGEMQAVARDVSPRLGNRIVCYCEPCQQFPIKLGRADAVLDAYGGTEIYQIPPAHLSITKGAEHLRCLKHTEKGLHRFYAGCCDTPFANAPGPGLPFIGVLGHVDTESEKRDARIGPIRGHVHTQGATKPLPADRSAGAFGVILRILGQMIAWRVRGVAKPHPFFGEDGQPIVEPEVRAS